jgi:hypothetical protein
MADIAIPAPSAVPPVAHEGPPPAIPDFQIVPRAGLPIVGVVLVALIVSIAVNGHWALDLFLGFILGPILGRLSIPARVEFTTRLMPKMLLLMPTLVTMTLASGWELGRHLGTINSGSPAHGWLVASYIVVGIMAVVALGLLEPANVAVLFELKKPRPNPAIIEKLMKRFIFTAGITGAMQVATLVIMTRVTTL